MSRDRQADNFENGKAKVDERTTRTPSRTTPWRMMLDWWMWRTTRGRLPSPSALPYSRTTFEVDSGHQARRVDRLRSPRRLDWCGQREADEHEYDARTIGQQDAVGVNERRKREDDTREAVKDGWREGDEGGDTADWREEERGRCRGPRQVGVSRPDKRKAGGRLL
ncbi:hypothetical protein BD626DRAFT_203817 [Schizophyllum amplum]|uniref:Uncharacterized protein n=1 Tax=Schizophyllum amplum TaxID=97359 RepID=A0A550BZN5_9AGAR|nr:hypothetical protein BD626DRAFT_203817 [Auriculariopsis ampla]